MKLVDKMFAKMVDRRIEQYQSEMIEKHCEEVQNIYKTMRGWRHDYHNHIQTLLALCGDEERTKEYLYKLNDDLTQVDTVIKTGNVMVDAILNSKLSLIASKNIQVNAKAHVPENLGISEIDLCTIIGNLLDNALEACMQQNEEEERFIRVNIGILKEQLYIAVHNSSKGALRKNKGRYLSTKKETGHGFGLMRVDSIVEKHQGFLNRQDEDGVFATEILLPINTV